MKKDSRSSCHILCRFSVLDEMRACIFGFFFFNDPASTEIYTLSLHDALPIYHPPRGVGLGERRRRGGLDLRREHRRDRKSTRLNSSHVSISYAVFCLKKKKRNV